MPEDSTKSSEPSTEPTNTSAWPPHQSSEAPTTIDDTTKTDESSPLPQPDMSVGPEQNTQLLNVETQSPVATVQRVVEPQTTPVTTPETAKSSAGVLVLQWLTYAFWGWTVLALAWLTSVSVGFFVSRDSYGSDVNSAVAYSLAAVIVLFIISFLCDLFYSKREPLYKHGAATIIMIIHAVIFALFGIGSLILAVFAVVRMLIGDSNGSSYGDDGSLTMLITGLVIALVYGATLLRTLRPFKLKRSSQLYWLFMAVVSITVTALGIVGPTVFASQTRNDRLIERSLTEVSESIRTYTDDNGKLPASLDDVSGSLSDDGKELIDKRLVDYTPGAAITTSTNTRNGLSLQLPTKNSSSVYKYKLCVTYVAKRGSGSVRPSSDDVNPSTYSHAAGRVCYNLVTDYSYNYDKQLY